MPCGSSALCRTCSRRIDDELEEEEAGGKGAAHRATAARGPVSGCERDAVPPLTQLAAAASRRVDKVRGDGPRARRM